MQTEQKIEPRGDYRVLIEPESRAAELQRNTAGLHVVEPSKQGAPNIGVVYAAGAKVTRCKQGQRVVFDEQHPKGIKFNGRVLFGIQERQIVAVLDD